MKDERTDSFSSYTNSTPFNPKSKKIDGDKNDPPFSTSPSKTPTAVYSTPQNFTPSKIQKTRPPVSPQPFPPMPGVNGNGLIHTGSPSSSSSNGHNESYGNNTSNGNNSNSNNSNGNSPNNNSHNDSNENNTVCNTHNSHSSSSAVDNISSPERVPKSPPKHSNPQNTIPQKSPSKAPLKEKSPFKTPQKGTLYHTGITKGDHGLGLDLGKTSDGRVVVQRFKELPSGIINPAQKAVPKIRPGDFITGINGVKCGSFAECVTAIRNCTGIVELELERIG
jgi:hypothetical protein